MNQKGPISGQFVIHPDGGVSVIGGTYYQDELNILPYLGTSYFGDHPLQQGSTWQTNLPSQGGIITTTFDVQKVDGDLATIRTESKTEGALGSAVTLESDIVYDAPLLVPISLRMWATVHGSSGNSTENTVTTYHFERKSDTRAPGGK